MNSLVGSPRDAQEDFFLTSKKDMYILIVERMVPSLKDLNNP